MHEVDMLGRDKIKGKNEYPTWVGANNYVKDKIIRDYTIQIMGVNTKKIKQIQLKENRYQFTKNKVKSEETKLQKDDFQGCLAGWAESREMEEKMTTSISILAHYKRYIVEERKIMLKKPNKEKAALLWNIV